jgi:sortase A
MRATDDVRPIPVRPQRRGAHRIVRTIGILGRVFVGAGMILLFYTAYLLWGTGVYTKQEQKRAADTLARNPIVEQENLSKGNIPPAKPASTKLGEPLFTLKVPKIGLETVVVQGIGREELKKGPGHFPNCGEGGAAGECVTDAKYPGENGNVAISGHRTTYGAPFFRLNELEKGDVIDFISGRARYRYRVREQRIVDPVSGFATVEQHGKDEVTLTTCHPRFSAAQRLVVQGDYLGASIISAPTPAGGTGDVPSTAKRPVIPSDVLVLGSIAAASALAALGLSKRHQLKALYIAIVIAGAAGLWVGVFPRVLALMPANY